MQQFKRTIALCDDDRSFLDVFRPQVKAIAEQLHFDCDIVCYESGSALLNDIRGGKKINILLLDVMMDELDGLALARQLRKETISVTVIFVSSSRDSALYGYELNALRFLEKPVKEERLYEALSAAVQKQQTQMLVIQGVNGLHRVDPRSVSYAEMLCRGVQFVFRDGTTLETHMKISEVEKALPAKAFYRCHQGYIVNLDIVSTLTRTDAILSDGHRIPVSRYKLAILRERFLSYLEDD